MRLTHLFWRSFVCSPQRVCWPAILDEMKENGFHSFYLASNHISWAELGLQFPSFRHKVKAITHWGEQTKERLFFLIAVTQGSHDFRFDMGRMGIRAGKFTSPEFFDKEVLVLLVRNMCESFDKNGKTKCAHKCFTQSKGFIL